jgi:hypothetical protein
MNATTSAVWLNTNSPASHTGSPQEPALSTDVELLASDVPSKEVRLPVVSTVTVSAPAPVALRNSTEGGREGDTATAVTSSVVMSNQAPR